MHSPKARIIHAKDFNSNDYYKKLKYFLSCHIYLHAHAHRRQAKSEKNIYKSFKSQHVFYNTVFEAQNDLWMSVYEMISFFIKFHFIIID